jgi:branched-chain amino acid transport system substrate-binding protein
MPGAARAGLVCAVLGALVLAGCSTTTNSAVTVSGGTLEVYLSQPPGGVGGQTAADVLDAERLALPAAGVKVGTYTVKPIVVHGGVISDNARTAIQDTKAIAYIGEIEPGTSQVSVEINNELGLLEVSPTDTAVYLTQPTPAVSGAPGTYYPSNSSYHQTFARVVPTTAKEAKAIIAEMSALHLSKVDVLSDGQPYGASIAAEIKQDASGGGVSAVSDASAADAVFYGGNDPGAATKALDTAAAANPSAKLFAPSALYSDTFVAGLSSTAQKNLYVSSPGFAPSDLPAAARQFETSFRSAYGHDPVPEAIFGYAATSALLAVLKNAGKLAGNRAAIVTGFRSFHSTEPPPSGLPSVLGTYSINGGDTNLDQFVFARAQSGRLVPLSQG